MSVKELKPHALYRRCDPAKLGFHTTAELEDITEVVGQPRAAAALAFGVGIRPDGFNLFAHGAPGTGKQTLVLQSLRAHAASLPVPSDLCYVHNFDDARKPRLLQLPAGTAAALSRDMERFVDELRAAVASAFESDEYQQRRQAIEEEVKERPAKALEEIGERAKQAGLGVVHTPSGFMVAALRGGEIVTDEAFQQLPEAERQRLQAKIEVFQREVEKTVRRLPRWLHDRRDRLRALSSEVTAQAVAHLLEELREKYASVPSVLEHLDRVQRDVVERAEQLLEPETSLPEALLEATPRGFGRPPALRRYRINVVVDNAGQTGAPVVYEDNPTYDNLIGRVEHAAQFGALVTDFTLIKGGALHRAGGGFLVLEAHKLLRTPYAWEALKRALQSRRLRIESLGQALSLVSTVSLEPEPAPLQVRVVILGEPMLYYLLCALDPEFADLFKVTADFDDQIDATDDNRRRYAQLIATLVRREKLKPFDATGVARVLEQSARLAGDQEKLTARIAVVLDLLCEADYWAGQAAATVVAAAHVQQGIDAQTFRADRVRQRVHEEIGRHIVMIDTAGATVGQVNGLSLSLLGNFAFGRPTRITARVRMGRGDVVDIEREVELGGPLHSKGVLILAAYVGARYVPDRPLALSASLVFEQSYSSVEGDSASAAELFALLSAIAEVPISQGLAVTGSVNQHGEIQVVGNVNEKIEGFFDVCRARGLTGDQGVIIPAGNAQHLMLRQDVVDAVAAGKFHIYPIHTVDEGLELLTGLPAGEREPAGGPYPEGSVNRLIEDRLIQLAETLQALGPVGAAFGEP